MGAGAGGYCEVGEGGGEEVGCGLGGWGMWRDVRRRLTCVRLCIPRFSLLLLIGFTVLVPKHCVFFTAYACSCSMCYFHFSASAKVIYMPTDLIIDSSNQRHHELTLSHVSAPDFPSKSVPWFCEHVGIVFMVLQPRGSLMEIAGTEHAGWT